MTFIRFVRNFFVQQNEARQYRAVRFETNPIITPNMLPKGEGDNINGPSLIRVPDWIENPLGKYYLYFAHHKGRYVRLAYADHLKGPWKIFETGVLHLESCICSRSTDITHNPHLASPDVHIDRARSEIVMYFHCPLYSDIPVNGKKTLGQHTLRATSKDGLHFIAEEEPLGGPYFRVFQWNDMYYAIARLGVLYRSQDGKTQFEKGPNPFDDGNKKKLRHAAVMSDEDTLTVFYSRIGDKPECIMVSTIALSEDWNAWKPTSPRIVLKPELEYEGGHLPLGVSTGGMARTPVRQLRDPAIYKEDGRTFLLYSVAGEHGIAIAELLTS